MRSVLRILSLSLAFSGSVLARDYADAIKSAASFQYLKDAKAVAISGTEMFFDGGSLSFKIVAEDGKKTVFVLSAESQRNDRKRFLSIYEDQHILLIPDSSHDQLAILLLEKLAAGLASGLQQKWPNLKEDAEALCLLLKEGGHSKDLEDFYAIRARQTKKDKEPNQASEPTAAAGRGSP